MLDHITVDTIIKLIENYGTITLFVLLALGIIALPVPEETLLTMTGIWLSNGTLTNAPLVFVAALGGSICGITVSYFLGRYLGHFVLHRIGSWFGFTEARFQKAHNWFENYGKWSLFIGYFIPGVRHFTGLSAGAAELEYRHFALFAYSGALFWVSTFLSLGYFFGDYWMSLFESIEEVVEGSTLAIIAAVVGVLFLIGAASYLKKRVLDKKD